MSRHVIATAFICAFLGSLGQAQQSGSPASPPADKPPSGQSKAPSEAPVAQGLPVNIKIDLTITDQSGPGEPAKKTITIIAADRSAGSIRTYGNASFMGNRAIINVDATPQVLSNGNVKVMLGLEYNPRQAERAGDKGKAVTAEGLDLGTNSGGSGLNQRVTVILEPGKPLVFSQAADPMSDRKISVEVRAIVLK
jgi:hypothetical protein